MAAVESLHLRDQVFDNAQASPFVKTDGKLRVEGCVSSLQVLASHLTKDVKTLDMRQCTDVVTVFRKVKDEDLREALNGVESFKLDGLEQKCDDLYPEVWRYNFSAESAAFDKAITELFLISLKNCTRFMLSGCGISFYDIFKEMAHDSQYKVNETGFEELDISNSPLSYEYFYGEISGTHFKGNLRKFKLNDCFGVNEFFQKFTKQDCENVLISIETFSIARTDITLETFEKLRPYLGNLKKLNITACEKLSEDDIAEIKRSLDDDVEVISL